MLAPSPMLIMIVLMMQGLQHMLNDKLYLKSDYKMTGNASIQTGGICRTHALISGAGNIAYGS